MIICWVSGCKEPPRTQSEETLRAEKKPKAERILNDVSDQSRPSSRTPRSLDEIDTGSIQSLLEKSDGELQAYFGELNGVDPQRSCDLILQLPLSKQEGLIANAVTALAISDAKAAIAFVDSLEVGSVRRRGMSALGLAIDEDDWTAYGDQISQMYPEDQTVLANASRAQTKNAVMRILSAMEANGMKGEAVEITQTKLAYILGRDEANSNNVELVASMSQREKISYIDGIASTDPKLALTTALHMSETDPSLLSRTSGQLIAALFNKDAPTETTLLITSLNLDPVRHEALMRPLIFQWIEEQPGSASEFIRNMPQGNDRNVAVKSLISYLKRVGDHQAAYDWNAYLENQ